MSHQQPISQLALLELMQTTLSRLAAGADFQTVTEETGIQAHITAAIEAQAQPHFVFVQEGGSSQEIYLIGWPSRAEAEQGRVSCSEASYRTSEIVEIPGNVAAIGGDLMDTIQSVLEASLDFSYAETPDDDGDDEDDSETTAERTRG